MEKHRNLRQHKAAESTHNNGEAQEYKIMVKHRNRRQHKAPESTQNNGETQQS